MAFDAGILVFSIDFVVIAPAFCPSSPFADCEVYNLTVGGCKVGTMHFGFLFLFLFSL